MGTSGEEMRPLKPLSQDGKPSTSLGLREAHGHPWFAQHVPGRSRSVQGGAQKGWGQAFPSPRALPYFPPPPPS